MSVDGKPRSDTMKQAYTDELKALEVSIDSLKQRMEAWYAKRLEDKDLVDENPDKIEYTSLMTEADQLTTNMQNSTKLVKNAIVPRLFIGSSLNTKPPHTLVPISGTSEAKGEAQSWSSSDCQE